MVPCSTVPPHHQNWILLGCLVYGLHVTSYCGWAMDTVGVLVGGTGPQPSWLQWLTSPVKSVPTAGTLGKVVTWALKLMGSLMCTAWLLLATVTAVGTLKQRACSLCSQLRYPTSGNVRALVSGAILPAPFPGQESLWRIASPSQGCLPVVFEQELLWKEYLVGWVE